MRPAASAFMQSVHARGWGEDTIDFILYLRLVDI